MITLTLLGVATIFGADLMAALSPDPRAEASSTRAAAAPATVPAGRPAPPADVAAPGRAPSPSSMLRSPSTDGGS
jgi:hypothetical protein